EARLESLYRLRGERDFRDEHNGTFTLFERVGDGLEVDFGFAAAGDAVKEEYVAALACDTPRRRCALLPWNNGQGVQALRDALQCGGLRGGEGKRLGGQDVLASVWVALGDLW